MMTQKFRQMIKEIGSEFWSKKKEQKLHNLEYFDFGQDIKYLMSGQTAIDYIIKNINSTKKIVYMPNYCCESMVNPFIDNGYKIKYYNVDLENIIYDINYDEEFDIFYAMSYFGFSKTNMDKHIKKIKEKNIIIIEDITHRIFQKKAFCEHSDYLIASLRKWFPIYSGAIAINVKNKFNVDTSNYVIDDIYIEQKKKAMKLKKLYIENIIDDKKEYLELFDKSNHKILEYQNKKMDDESKEIIKEIDIKKMIEKRKNNAKTIEKILKNSNIKLLFKLEDDDCPLFFPITSKNRDIIRRKLIKKNIYCPIHWPNSNNINNRIYDEELSLICDQRYKDNEIEEYIRILENIVERI